MSDAANTPSDCRGGAAWGGWGWGVRPVAERSCLAQQPPRRIPVPVLLPPASRDTVTPLPPCSSPQTKYSLRLDPLDALRVRPRAPAKAGLSAHDTCDSPLPTPTGILTPHASRDSLPAPPAPRPRPPGVVTTPSPTRGTHCAFTRLMVSGSASLGVTYSTARSMISCSLASASSRFWLRGQERKKK